MAVNLGKASYPQEEEIDSLLKSAASRVFWVNATEIAEDLGNPAVVGVVLLGVLSGLVGGEENAWLNVIKRMVPERFVELNMKAFR